MLLWTGFSDVADSARFARAGCRLACRFGRFV
jgi:hypothetical protein